MRMAVHHGVDRLTELGGPLDARAVRERQREPTRLLVPLRPDEDHRPVALVVEQAPVPVDKPEAAIAANAVRLELNLVPVQEAARSPRRDRDPGDAGWPPSSLGLRSDCAG